MDSRPVVAVLQAYGIHLWLTILGHNQMPPLLCCDLNVSSVVLLPPPLTHQAPVFVHT